MLEKLSTPEGLMLTLNCCGKTVLVTVEDHREHPDFSGDRSADEWCRILENLAAVGLDPNKAVVSLSCRNEPIKGSDKKTFNVGVVQMGWVQ